MWRMRTLASISITRTYQAKWKSRKYKITCNRQFSTPLSCLSTVDSYSRATKCNQGRVPLIYSLWGFTGVLILLGPETEVKQITSEIITQSNTKKCGKINLNTFFYRVIFLNLDVSFFVYLRTMSSKNISKTLSFLPDVKSAEKQLHEHEVETTTSFVMYYSYSVCKGKSKVRGTPQMNSGYEREC